MRRRSLRPPDLTSLFDVLFILVFVSLVNAGINKQAVDRAEARAPRARSGERDGVPRLALHPRVNHG